MDYDPMLSKLIAYAPTREEAIVRLLRALDEYVICGIRTNLAFFRRILSDPDFKAAKIDTGYLDRLLAQPPGDRAADGREERERIAAIAAAIFESQRTNVTATAPQPASAWKRAARERGLGR